MAYKVERPVVINGAEQQLPAEAIANSVKTAKPARFIGDTFMEITNKFK